MAGSDIRNETTASAAAEPQTLRAMHLTVHPPRGLVRKILLGLLALILLALCAAIVLVKSEYVAEQIRDLVVEKLSRALDAEISIGKLRLQLLPAGVVLEEVSFRPRGRARLASARRIAVRVRLLDLLRSRISIEEIAIDGAEVTLEIRDGRVVNLPKPRSSGPPSSWEVWVGRIIVTRSSARVVASWSSDRKAEPVRKLLAYLARARGASPPSGPVTVLARLTDLRADLWNHQPAVWGGQLEVGSGRIDAPGMSEILDRLRARAFLAKKDFYLDYLELALARSELALLLTGAARDLPALAGGGEGAIRGRVVLAAPVTLARRFVAQMPPLAGRVTLDAEFSGRRPRDIEGQGHIRWTDARIGNQRLGTVAARLSGSRREVRFSETTVRGAGAGLSASGRVSLERSPRIEASVSLENLGVRQVEQLAGLKPLGVQGSATGTVTISGRLVRQGGRLRPDLTATTDLVVKGLSLSGSLVRRQSGLSFPTLKVRSRLRILPSRIRVIEGVVILPSSRIYLRGDVGPGDRIRAEVNVPALRLAELGTVVGIPASGRGRLRARVQGRLSNPVVDGNFSLTRVAFRGIDIDRIDGLVQYQAGVLSIPVGAIARGATRVAFGAAVDLKRQQVEADAEILRGRSEDVIRLLRIPGISSDRYSAAIRGEIKVRGPLRNPRGWGTIRLTDVSIYGEPVHEVVARGAYTDAGWAVDQLQVRKTAKSGLLEVYGVVTPAGELSFVVFSQGFSLGALGFPALRRTGLLGKVDLHAVVQGTLLRPEAHGGLMLRGVTLRGIQQPDSELQFRLIGKRLWVDGRLLGNDVRVQGEASLAGKIPFQADIGLQNFEFTSLFRNDRRKLRGKTSGKGRISGQATDGKSIRGRLALSQLLLDAPGGYTLKNREPVVLTLRGARLNVESLEIAGRDTEVSVTGSRGANGELDFNVEGKVDLRIAEYLMTGLVQPAGVLRFKSRVAGTLEQPSLLGSGQLTGVRGGLKGFPHDVRDLSARLLFTQNRVVVQELKGQFSDGRFKGRGQMTLNRFLPDTFRIALELDETNFRYPADFPMRVSGNLELSGNLDKQALTGQINLLRARYSKDLKLSDLLKKKRKAPSVYQRKREHLSIAVRIVARDDIRVVNNLADLEFKGELTLRGTNRAMGVVGSLQLARPGKIRQLRRTFAVKRAFVVFKGGDTIDPYLDIEATTKVRQYDILLAVKSRLSKLKLEYSCGSGLSTADCLFLLQTGLTQKELNTVTSGRGSNFGISTAIDAVGAITGLDDKVLEAVPIFDTFQLGSGYSQYSASVVPLLTIGKQITKYVNLYGTANLQEPSRDFRARVEVTLSRNLSLAGEYVTLPRTSVSGAGVGQSLGNIGVDLRWRYEF